MLSPLTQTPYRISIPEGADGNIANLTARHGSTDPLPQSLSPRTLDFRAAEQFCIPAESPMPLTPVAERFDTPFDEGTTAVPTPGRRGVIASAPETRVATREICVAALPERQYYGSRKYYYYSYTVKS